MAIDGLRALIVDDNCPTAPATSRRSGRSQPRPRTVIRRPGPRGLGRPTSKAWQRRCAPTPRTSARWTPISHDPARASGFARRHWPRGSGHRVALHPRRSAATLAGPSPDAQQVRELVCARDHAAAGARLCTSGFRCWTRDSLARLPLDRIVSDGYAFLVELAWEAQAAGGRIVEVPITFVERREGQSKMSGRVIASRWCYRGNWWLGRA